MRVSRRLTMVAALVRPTARALPWTVFTAGWALGLAVAAVPVVFSMDLPAVVLADLARVAALCGAVGTAFVLDDPARHTTGVPPVPRPLRQAVRAALVLPALAVWWAAVLGVLRAGADAEAWAASPVGALTVEAGALCALALALAAAAVRFTVRSVPGPAVSGAVTALPVLAGVLLPKRFALFVPPGAPRWDDAHVLWAGILAALLAVWLLCAREPYRCRLGALHGPALRGPALRGRRGGTG
ncbi:ABC transporter [Streptomyces scabiei]|nr:ABC transporter [Streptomyces sp. LBUM 1484]MBP5880223.1 ABC transporter [Streptomyces sp. LBUM 1477]MBP5888063.1 ABC transporter [Streptomyces sp. LBUM 1487]MBP5904076.1 ABC transporter [Streptomyces sp. LBUM 1488]QTU50112.1 ABC transporter [Streptomyces sp. LBUM 1482]QTU66332.1 ABC transporter [Streptomyces sp. LBUM 1475]